MPVDPNRMRLIERRLLPSPEPLGDLQALKADTPLFTRHEEEPAIAAVLVPLIRREATHTILYTERSSALRNHSGQIAFPGGRVDPGDKSAADAALREAEEEIALVRSDARVIGYLPNLFTPSNYMITPVVAEIVPSAPFVPNPAEVESIFEVPLDLIAANESYAEQFFDRGGRRVQTWRLDHEGYTIWGITAALTRRFFEMALHGETA